MEQLLSATYLRSLTNESTARKEIAEGMKKAALDGCSFYVYKHKDGDLGSTLVELNRLGYKVTRHPYGFLTPEIAYKISW